MSTVPKILQNLRKRDDKSRTFAPPDNTTAPSSLKCIDEELSRLKNPDHKKYSFEDKLTFDEVKKLLILK